MVVFSALLKIYIEEKMFSLLPQTLSPVYLTTHIPVHAQGNNI